MLSWREALRLSLLSRALLVKLLLQLWLLLLLLLSWSKPRVRSKAAGFVVLDCCWCLKRWCSARLACRS